jgi:hypothetical protein
VTNNGFQQFTASNKNFAQKWKDFRSEEIKSVFNSPSVPVLTPFYSTPLFSSLSLNEQNNLYRAFIQFTAEALIFLELLLYEGLISLKKSQDNEELKLASEKLMAEEKLHTQAFLRFLKKDCSAFPHKSYLLRNNSTFKNSFLWLARNFPVALALPAAKVEAYTIFYSQALDRAYGGAENSWSKLNSLHLSDETHHVGYEFQMYECEMRRYWGPFKIIPIFATLIAILFFQVCFLIGCWRMVKLEVPRLSFFRHIYYVGSLGKWILRNFQPYRETRKFIKTQFTLRKPSYGFLFRFMYK